MFLMPDGQIHSYSINLRPWLWSNVQGKVGALDQTTKNIKEFWLAYGGGNSFTHGLSLKSNGNVKVEVISVSIK